MIRVVGEAPLAPAPRLGGWQHGLAGVTFMALAAASVVLGCGLAGGGWDVHTFRIAALLILLLAPTLLFVRPGRSTLERLGIALLGLILALAAWLFAPARPNGPTLYQAWTTRQRLQQRWEQVTFEDLKYADYYSRTLEELQQEFPSLAAPLADRWQQWIDSALSLIQQRFEAIGPEDVHAARLAYLQSAPLTQRLPWTRPAVDEAWQAWLKRAMAAQIVELNRLSFDQWERVQSTTLLRRRLAQYDAVVRKELIEAEQRWLQRSLNYHLEQAEQHLSTHPRQTQQQCRQLKERLRHLQLLEQPQDAWLKPTLERVFDLAQRAAVQEVMQHIQAQRYMQAYSVARIHALDWLPIVAPWGIAYRQRIESLRDTTRYLALLAERVPETLPPPRPADVVEIAPPPRSPGQ